MELEQRVKTLEYEMKILKNEIQRTLLDIQEQVLVHYYPALRTEEAGPSDGTIQAVEALRAKQVPAPAPAAPAPVAPIVEAVPAPAAKKVSLDEVRSNTGGAGASLPKLLEWVMNSGGKIGGPRTVKVIDIYGRKGYMPADVKSSLMAVASLNKETPEKVAANDVLNGILELDKLLGRAANPDEALALIEEASLG